MSSQWLTPYSTITPVAWQGFFGLLLLAMIFYWMFIAFVHPPKFNKHNSYKFCKYLEHAVLKGNQNELSEIISETTRSAESLVNAFKSASQTRLYIKKRGVKKYFEDRRLRLAGKTRNNAGYVFLLLGNRLVCNLIIRHSPITAITLCELCIKEKCFNVPIGQFLYNISTEAIKDKGSLLYLEQGSAYSSGVIGQGRRFTKAIYGSFDLISNANPGPLHLDYKFREKLDSDQLDIFKEVVLLAFQDYVKLGGTLGESSIFLGVLHDFEHYYFDESSEKNNAIDERDSWKFHIVTSMFGGMIKALADDPNLKDIRLRNNESYSRSIYDALARAGLDAIFTASTYPGDPDSTWSVHLHTWNDFFESFDSKNKGRAIVAHKLRRLIYEELKRLREIPNFKSSRIIGLCINILGFVDLDRLRQRDGKSSEYILAKVIYPWLETNFLKLYKNKKDIAESMLLGTITFDEENRRLVKTYRKGIADEAPKEFFNLEAKDSYDSDETAEHQGHCEPPPV